MNAVKMAGIGLIVAGILGLAYGGFSYTSATHETKLDRSSFRSRIKRESTSRFGLGWGQSWLAALS